MASFSVVTNIAAVNATANLYSTQLGLNKALTRVSSGFRINSSADEAAGLAVANGFRSKVAILAQGVRNANDALSDLWWSRLSEGNPASFLPAMPERELEMRQTSASF